jgi:hypothetical protein
MLAGRTDRFDKKALLRFLRNHRGSYLPSRMRLPKLEGLRSCLDKMRRTGIVESEYVRERGDRNETGKLYYRLSSLAEEWLYRDWESGVKILDTAVELEHTLTARNPDPDLILIASSVFHDLTVPGSYPRLADGDTNRLYRFLLPPLLVPGSKKGSVLISEYMYTRRGERLSNKVSVPLSMVSRLKELNNMREKEKEGNPAPLKQQGPKRGKTIRS